MKVKFSLFPISLAAFSIGSMIKTVYLYQRGISRAVLIPFEDMRIEAWVLATKTAM